MNQSQASGVIRHILTLVGGAGVAGSDDDLAKLVSAFVAFVGVAWSIWVKRANANPQPPPGPGPAVLPLLAVLSMVPALVGCRTPGSPLPILTPARVESVSALGSYFAGKAVIAKGHRAELEQALKALQVLSASESADLVAVAAALEAAGVPGIGSSEGILVLGAVSTFSDLWAQTGQHVLDGDLARAAVRGLVRGLELALAQPRGLVLGDPIGGVLLDDAVATRPAR